MADDILQAFSAGLSVSKEKNDSTLLHPRFDDYKGRYFKSGDQAYRRGEVLERQKKKRFDAANYARKLAEGDLEEEEFEEAVMEIEHSGNKKGKRFNPYKNQLMLSEWIVDPPSDLEKNWIMVICPVGKRLLVVANKGYTSAYTKSGYLFNSFPSWLPGGSFKTCGKNSNKFSNFTILDCIYDEVNRTYWMIDLMCYQGNPIYDSDVEFRFFWLHSKLIEDCPEVREQSKSNPFKFIPCDNVSCDADSISSAITDMHPFDIDGVLFYHKSSHYQPGRTPLVGWLKPYMIPSILGVTVPQSVLETAPVEFNRNILLDANKKLQDTVSDRSFNNPLKSPEKKENKETSVNGKNDMDT